MYIPRKFRQENIEQLVVLMQQYPFATLVTHSNEGIDATHLPVMFKQVGERFVLKAHIAKATLLHSRLPQWFANKQSKYPHNVFYGDLHNMTCQLVLVGHVDKCYHGNSSPLKFTNVPVSAGPFWSNKSSKRSAA